MPRPPDTSPGVHKMPGAVYSPFANLLASHDGPIFPLHVGDTWMEPFNGGRMQDLRVEDHPRPLAELGRLLSLHRAYELMNHGDEAMASGDAKLALERYAAAAKMFPDNDEFVFWHGVTLVSNGRVEESLPLFARAFRMNPSWMLLISRLVEKGHLPDTPGLTERILVVGP